MIQEVSVRRFKRFEEQVFRLDGHHFVMVGPNNCGKTTLLQAVAALAFTLGYWRGRGDTKKHNSHYARAPLSRQAFPSVPLKSFDHLWSDLQLGRGRDIELRLRCIDGRQLGMLIEHDTTEQAYVRPTSDTENDVAENLAFETSFIPPMSGLAVIEPILQPAFVNSLLGQHRPGDVLRNMIFEASQSGVFDRINRSLRSMFDCELIQPSAVGGALTAQYRKNADSPAFDLTSAGSGFQQALMLLTFIHTRPGSVLLVDEPDAHLHVFLQAAVFRELRLAAIERRSQLIIATHSEVIMRAIGLDELCVFAGAPLRLTDRAGLDDLEAVLKYADEVDLSLALQAPGVLYVEDYTDLDILREWARVLGHRAEQLLSNKPFWKPMTVPSPSGEGDDGITWQDHYKALRLVNAAIRGVVLLDGDSKSNSPQGDVYGMTVKRLRWTRYEIESYLIVPDAIDRFIRSILSGADADEAAAAAREYLKQNLPPAVLSNPLGDNPFLRSTKARRDIIPPTLSAAGLKGWSHTEYYRIAALMTRAEIHPEVTEKLDLICEAFGL